jgi:hypothetical protein
MAHLCIISFNLTARSIRNTYLLAGNQVLAREVDEVYQDDELPSSFNIDPDSALNSLLGNANDVIVPKQMKQTLRKKKKCKILNILYISYYVLYISYYIHAISCYLLYISLILCF